MRVSCYNVYFISVKSFILVFLRKEFDRNIRTKGLISIYTLSRRIASAIHIVINVNEMVMLPFSAHPKISILNLSKMVTTWLYALKDFYLKMLTTLNTSTCIFSIRQYCSVFQNDETFPDLLINWSDFNWLSTSFLNHTRTWYRYRQISYTVR